MELEEAKKRLKCYTKEQIVWSQHAEVRLLQRGITKEQVEQALLDSERLLEVIDQPSRSGETKIKLVFDQSGARSLIVVSVFSEKVIKVVTVIMRYRKWYDRVKKWQKK